MKVTNTGWSAAAYGLLRKADGSKQDAAAKTPQNELSKTQQDALDRLGKWQEAMKKLNALPSAQESRKASAQAKITELQRRLMDLKQLLLHATPQMAKALIAELKSIAGELGSAAKALAENGGSGASQVSVTVAGAAGTDAAAESGTAASADGAAQAAQAQADQAGQAAEAQADQAVQAAETQAGQAAAAASGQAAQAAQAGQERQNAGQAQGARAPGGSAQSSAKDALEEAKRLLKDVLSMMKAKLANAPKADRDRLNSVENSLDEIAQAQAAMAGPDLYSSLGTGVGDIGASVPSIDITA